MTALARPRGRPMGLQGQLDELVMEIASLNHERLELRRRGATLDLDEARLVKELASLVGSGRAEEAQVAG